MSRWQRTSVPVLPARDGRTLVSRAGLRDRARISRLVELVRRAVRAATRVLRVRKPSFPERTFQSADVRRETRRTRVPRSENRSSKVDEPARTLQLRVPAVAIRVPDT